MGSHDLHCLRILNIDSLLSVGLYQIDLWELTEASYYFERVIKIAKFPDLDRWRQKAIVCMALVQSHLKNIDRSPRSDWC